MFQSLQTQPGDPLLALIGAFRNDQRTGKMDLGVGVYKDEGGHTPVMSSVKKAERLLLNNQLTKSYLGGEGDLEFVSLLQKLVYGDCAVDPSRICGIQTPGGTGAIRVGAELAARANPDATAILGLPSWPNHGPILQASKLKLATYSYFDLAQQTVSFDTMISAIGRAHAGDIVILQACCHNPTGIDLDDEQWTAVGDAILKTGAVPLVDIAYQGLGKSMDADLRGARNLLQSVPEALIAVSCSKNFGLYRERTGALLVQSENADTQSKSFSNMLAIARAIYSMPPDHGAAVVRTILLNKEFEAEWRAELAIMQNRIAQTRQEIALAAESYGLDLRYVSKQQGMFTILPFSEAQIAQMQATSGVYMAANGRVNVAGVNSVMVPRLLSIFASLSEPRMRV
jgi:aromatic-amino-acid transaminase